MRDGGPVGGLAMAALTLVALAACGSSTPASSPPSSSPAASPTPQATPTPGPSTVQATLTGDPGLTGALVAGSVHFVTCDEPSLSGPSILAFRSAANPSIGVLLTIRQGSIHVRLAEGSGTSYTERDFDGTGVASFDAASGAQFSSTLTESTAAGTTTGTIGKISSIAGSVSCGSFTVGSASVTITGSTEGGAMSGALTGVRVLCGASGTGHFATVTGLTNVGSTPAVVEVGGGTQGSPFFVVVQTAGAAYQFQSSAAGATTVTAEGATYNSTVREISPTAGAHTLMVSGSAVCGSSS